MAMILFALFFVLMVITLVAGNDPNVQFVNHVVLLGTIVCMGLSMGSFATALAYRLPRGLPYGQGPDGRPVRSLCPPCGKQLTFFELIPVVSWVVQGGKCQCGKKAISITYPAIEIGTLFYTWMLYELNGFAFAALPKYFIVPFAVAAIMIAWTHGRIPPKLITTLMTMAAIAVLVAIGLNLGQFEPESLLRKLALLVAIVGVGAVVAFKVPDFKRIYVYASNYLQFAVPVAVMSFITHPIITFFAVAVLMVASILDYRQLFDRKVMPLVLAGLFALFLMMPISI